MGKSWNERPEGPIIRIQYKLVLTKRLENYFESLFYLVMNLFLKPFILLKYIENF